MVRGRVDGDWSGWGGWGGWGGFSRPLGPDVQAGRATRVTPLWGFRSLGVVAGKEPVGEDKEHDCIEQQGG